MSPGLPQTECGRCGRNAPVHPRLGIACPCAARDNDPRARQLAAEAIARAEARARAARKREALSAPEAADYLHEIGADL